jgi:carbamoyl-phosphate synthase/aspartate carbamoyltransferase/dihydroorotase
MLDKELNMDLTFQNRRNKHLIGVKVPQFSFNRLQGADINLGVDMVSTGEVACFGKNKYEAYIKGLVSTGFRLPHKSVLLSVGSYRFKKEFEDSVKVLQDLGYELYGTYGTADYYKENGINIIELDKDSINEYISSRMIDIVVIISSMNKSKIANLTDGYQIRRKAIESSVPVITDIKSAKLFVNALNYYIRIGSNLGISTDVDCFTSYKTVRLPGLIDVHVHVREPGAEYKEDWESCTKAAIAGGITTIFAMPNTDPAIIDNKSFNKVCKIAESKACCDYGIFVGASTANGNNIYNLSREACGLKMYLNNTYGPLLLDNTLDWNTHIERWPKDKVICVHAEAQTLAAVLHLANLHKQKIHVCHVARKEEIELIKHSKEAGMNVTCEVAPHHLFLTGDSLAKEICEVRPKLVRQEDQDALWENMDIIDCFATDHAPHTLEDKVKHGVPGFSGLETALPLLLTAVRLGRLSLQDIIDKYHTNPSRIFGIEVDNVNETYVEVDLDREWTIPEKMKYSKSGWTPFTGFKVNGMIKRVVIRNKTVYIDGQMLAKKGYGQMKVPLTNYGQKLEDTINETADIIIENIEVNDSDNDNEKKINNIKLDNIVSVKQFNKEMLRVIFEKASKMRKLVKEQGTSDILKNKVMASVFYEPSTRTRCSFTVAMERLGGKVVEVGCDESSIKKGESFEDFMRTMECYSDLVVVRSSIQGCMERAVNSIRKPIINAGDGVGEHPTQALLDAYTIREERGTLNGLTVTMIGDLKHGRTVHSLAKLLSMYNVRFRYVSPDELKMPKDVMKYVEGNGCEQTEHRDLHDVLETTDILYVTRIQKERFENEDEYNIVKGSYVITPHTLANAKDNLVIMHPLPRVDEISTEIDADPRVAYFRQMEYGMYVRMAILTLMLE